MIHKLILTAVGVTLVGGFLFGRDAVSYVTTGCRPDANTVRDSVPVEFQIERARQMARDLGPVIRESMHVIAKEEVALEQLDEQISQAENKNGKDKNEIMQLQADLATGDSRFVYASHSYSRDDVKQDLSRRFDRFKVADETLANLQEMRKARSANLEAAREKFSAMVAAQRKLETDIAHLEAKHKLVEVAQASSEIIFDDSQLARAKQLVQDIRTSLDVKARLANQDVEVAAEIPVTAEATTDITEQVAEYFGTESAEKSPAEIAVVSHQSK